MSLSRAFAEARRRSWAIALSSKIDTMSFSLVVSNKNISPFLVFMTASTFPAKNIECTLLLTMTSGGSLAVNQIEQEMSSVLESHLESDMSSHQYQDALENALKDQDAALLATGMSHQGSTAAIALLDTARGLIVSADLGDSHIVLANKQPDEPLVWNVSRLSVLQNPSSTMERARIENAGGEINHTYGTARIGVSLSNEGVV